MSTKLQYFLFVMGIFTSLLGYAGEEEGGWISGGGDPLRIYFEEGRTHAALLIPEIKLEPNKIVSADVAEWFNRNKDALALDISKSEHAWHDQDQATCAFTEYRSQAPIKLSFDSCRSITSKEEAVKVLIHESVHHLGIADHTFGDRVAVQVVASWESKKLGRVAFCPDNTPPIVKSMLGKWNMDPLLAKVIVDASDRPRFSAIELKEDKTILKQFDEYKNFFGGCALSAGTLHWQSANGRRENTVPYFIRKKGLQLFLITFRSEEDVGRRRLSARSIQLVKSDRRKKDKLIITAMKNPELNLLNRRVDRPGTGPADRPGRDIEVETFERGEN